MSIINTATHQAFRKYSQQEIVYGRVRLDVSKVRGRDGGLCCSRTSSFWTGVSLISGKDRLGLIGDYSRLC
jgi:hypothetical protein